MDVISVARCAIVKRGKLLLLWNVKRAHYEMPGGKVEPGETLEKAAIREAWEETGCTVVIKKILSTVDKENEEGKKFRWHVFLAETNGEPRIAEPQSFSKLVWMPIRDYKEYTLHPAMKKLMEILMKEKV